MNYERPHALQLPGINRTYAHLKFHGMTLNTLIICGVILYHLGLARNQGVQTGDSPPT